MPRTNVRGVLFFVVIQSAAKDSAQNPLLSSRHFVIQSTAKDPVRNLLLSSRHFVIQSAAKDPARMSCCHPGISSSRAQRRICAEPITVIPAFRHPKRSEGSSAEPITVIPAFRHPKRSEGSSAEPITVIPALCRDHLTQFLLQGVYDKGGLAPSLRLNANNYSRLRCSTSHLALAHSSKVSSARWSLASCIKCR